MVHELKILPEYFDEVRKGNKTFELRKDNREYNIDDYLILKEWDGEYTGNKIGRVVTYVLRNVEKYGLKRGFVIIGMK